MHIVRLASRPGRRLDTRLCLPRRFEALNSLIPFRKYSEVNLVPLNLTSCCRHSSSFLCSLPWVSKCRVAIVKPALLLAPVIQFSKFQFDGYCTSFYSLPCVWWHGCSNVNRDTAVKLICIDCRAGCTLQYLI